MIAPGETIVARIRTLLPQKLILGTLLSIVFAAPYYATQYASLRPVFPMPATWLDQMIPFQPGMAWLYVSWYPMLAVSPLLLATAAQARRYAAGIVAIGVVGNLLFLLAPTGVARPPLPAEGNWPYRAMVTIDRPVNACPSLHAALAVFTTLWFGRLCRAEPRLSFRRPRRMVAAMWAWTLAIFYGTIATRQHVLLDLIAGSALGAISYALTTRNGRTVKPPAFCPATPETSSSTAGSAPGPPARR